MNTQLKITIITFIFILFFAFTIYPIHLVSTIFNIHIIMYSSSIKSVSTESTLPCSYISSKVKSSSPATFLKNLVNNKKPTHQSIKASTSTTPSKHTPITIPTKLTQAQKKAALPFLAQEKPLKSKNSTSSKSKVNIQKMIFFMLCNQHYIYKYFRH